MTRNSQALLILAAVITVGTLAAVFVERVAPAPTPAPAPASATIPAPAPDYSSVSGNGQAAPAAAPATGSEERNRGLALSIESALVSRDPQRLETALATLLPQLIAADAGKVLAIFALQQPGETRDLLRDEIARQWVRQDRDSAIAWLKSLPDEAERKAAATTAMRGIAAADPAQAVIVADELGVGRDDGSLEHIVQIWAQTDRDAALRWLATQPAGDARTAQLRVRIEMARAPRAAVH